MRIERWNKGEEPSAPELRRALEAEGYHVFEWSDAPGTSYAAHRHREDQSHWIISGQLELRVQGRTYTLSAGDRDFLPADTVHAAFVPGTEPVRYLIGARR
ncbi:MAG TPA: cupin domain-containing protein [Pyrinomonadaceae bacterium]|nr:cupin domain-containing protein [Pyrinomonadaceae bacterium]